MAVEVVRSFDVAVPTEEVWDLLSDPQKRAEAISFVERYEIGEDVTTWHIKLPSPLINRTVAVRTQDIERRPPNYVKFVGRSKVMNVTGEHELTETKEGCRVRNRFVVEGKVPGVERFFKRNFDTEIRNILETVTDSAVLVEDA